jgi:CRISPR-associated protein Cas1
VQQKDDKLAYCQAKNGIKNFFAIPLKSVPVLILGPGTSVTNAANRMLAEENIILCWTGGGGSPLYYASQNEYRPTKYMQKWFTIWQDDKKRIRVAKNLQANRIDWVNQRWTKLGLPDVEEIGNRYLAQIELLDNKQDILLEEARYTKNLYGIIANHYKIEFERKKYLEENKDVYNQFLDHGNYLAYGIAASALWILGIPFSLPVLHGDTRRGALVFDIADIIKDGIIMPQAFESAYHLENRKEFRKKCIDTFVRKKILRYLILSIKKQID